MDSWSDDTVQERYLPFLHSWLLQRFACERVFIYAYNVSFGGVYRRGFK